MYYHESIKTLLFISLFYKCSRWKSHRVICKYSIVRLNVLHSFLMFYLLYQMDYLQVKLTYLSKFVKTFYNTIQNPYIFI